MLPPLPLLRMTWQPGVPQTGLPPEVAGPLFRITQEAVTNAGKHAGASNVTIRLIHEVGTVLLEIDDDGRGFGAVDPLRAAEAGHIGEGAIA